MKTPYLFDTNILSGLLSRDSMYVEAVNDFLDRDWAISGITDFELQLYKEKYDLPSAVFDEFIDPFIVYSLDRKIFETAAQIYKKRKQKRPHLADLLIVATSAVYGLSLVTADKDMKKYPFANVVLIS